MDGFFFQTFHYVPKKAEYKYIKNSNRVLTCIIKTSKATELVRGGESIQQKNYCLLVRVGKKNNFIEGLVMANLKVRSLSARIF